MQRIINKKNFTSNWLSNIYILVFGLHLVTTAMWSEINKVTVVNYVVYVYSLTMWSIPILHNDNHYSPWNFLLSHFPCVHRALTVPSRCAHHPAPFALTVRSLCVNKAFILLSPYVQHSFIVPLVFIYFHSELQSKRFGLYESKWEKNACVKMEWYYM